jgi:Cft2 family RNA processing exonuclease
MFFTSLTPREDIGGSCYLLEMGESRVILDCGMHPKEIGFASLPQLGALDYDSIDCLFLSHAHFDHLGGVPVLLQAQPSAETIMSEATRELALAMLHNSVHVMKSQRVEKGITELPLFTHRQVNQLARQWLPRPVGRSMQVGWRGEVTCQLHHAGHVLGATAATFQHAGKSVLYTGDILFEDQAIVRGAQLPTEQIDTLVIETTHGLKEPTPGYSRTAEISRLAAHIQACHDRGGAVLIPVFALGKSQEILVLIHQMKQRGEIPAEMPVMIGGLSTKITGIFDRLADRCHRHLEGFAILDEVDLTVASERTGNPLRYAPGSLFALSSGMMTERTVSNRFAPHILDDERNAIFFVGYCDPDTPGGNVLAAGTGGQVILSEGEEPIPIRCEVERFDLSGHADRDQILEFILEVDARQTLLVHGDPGAKEWFREQVAERLGSGRVLVPESGITIPL